MTRLFLPIALALQLSGMTAVGAFLCTQPGMTVQTCCCHHEADGQSSQAPDASAPCPCAMAPTPSAPVTQTPVTVSASHNPLATPAGFTAVRFDTAAGTHSQPFAHDFADTGPSLLSASHLRC